MSKLFFYKEEMDMYTICTNYVAARQLQVQVIDYGHKENLNEYLRENLEGAARLIRAMLQEFYTATPQRRIQLQNELDSAVLGWVETWNALHR
jgi:hypothetical protein